MTVEDSILKTSLLGYGQCLSSKTPFVDKDYVYQSFFLLVSKSFVYKVKFPILGYYYIIDSHVPVDLVDKNIVYQDI